MIADLQDKLNSKGKQAEVERQNLAEVDNLKAEAAQKLEEATKKAKVLAAVVETVKAALEGAQDQLERLKPPPEPTGRKRPITPKAAGSAAAARDGWSAQRAPKKVVLGDSAGLDKIHFETRVREIRSVRCNK